MRPTRETIEGRAYLDLQRKAKDEGRTTDELLSLYALECFLARLAESSHRDQLVLKGGVLLAAFDARRTTRDVDFQAQSVSNNPEVILGVISEIAAIAIDDGMVIDYAAATAQTIRDEDEYSGVRVSMKCGLSQARITFHVDVSVGDPIDPEPEQIELPRLLGGSITLSGYPMAMVYAEKIVTALSRGGANTRWRDFGDVFVLSGQHPIAGADLLTAISTVSSHRGVDLTSLSTALDGFGEIGQGRWITWRNRNGREELPESFGSTLDAVCAFADPALAGSVGTNTWDPSRRRWS